MVQKFVIFSMNNLGYHFCCGFIKYVYPDTDSARGLEKSDPDQVLTFLGSKTLLETKRTVFSSNLFPKALSQCFDLLEHCHALSIS